jgi:hypothetical protein
MWWWVCHCTPAMCMLPPWLPVTNPHRDEYYPHGHTRADTRPQNGKHHLCAPVARTPHHEPRLISERRERNRDEHWLKAFEPQHTARAGHRHGAKSCQDLRKHSSTRHQQRGDHRDDPGGLRSDGFHCCGRGVVVAGHGAFRAETQMFRSNVVSPADARLTISSPRRSGRVFDV